MCCRASWCWRASAPNAQVVDCFCSESRNFRAYQFLDPQHARGGRVGALVACRCVSFLSSYHHLVRGSLPLEHSVLFHSPYQSPRGSRCSIWTSPGEAWPHCSPAWWPGTWWPVTACPASTSTTPRLWPPAGPCPTLWQHSPPLQGPKAPF